MNLNKLLKTIILLVFMCISIFVRSQVNDISKGWKFKTGDDLQWAQKNFNDKDWKQIEVAKTWDEQGYIKHEGYAWYRVKFVIPSSIKEKYFLKDSLKIYLGKIDECDQVYLNAKLIGQNNNIITKTFEEPTYLWNVDRCYKVSASDEAINWDKENTLAIRVYNSSGAGGMYTGNPFIGMLDLIDYMSFNSDEMSFVTKKDKTIDNKIVMKNSSKINKIEGNLSILIKSIDLNPKTLFEKNIYITIDPLRTYFSTINFQNFENASISYTFKEKKSKKSISKSLEIPYILTPKPDEKPRINSAKIFGVRPDHPFLYNIAASGNKPIVFEAENLPNGLLLDKNTGFITGKISKRGEYKVTLFASNKKGKFTSELKIVCGDKIALTPTMGWNSWYVHEFRVADSIMRKAADAMVSSGMADYGYNYVDIDDCWNIISGDASKERSGKPRDNDGKILPNKYFPDMKAMTDYIHSKGLKAGIYISPGPRTCGGFEGSYKHEELDAKTFSDWGFDLLKYDWCSYSEIAPKELTIEDYKKPYKLMGDILKKQDRDIVFNLCQYGMGDVWKWGEEVGGNSWRTTGDLGGSFEDIPKAIYSFGFGENGIEKYAGPGAWNDPDYLLLGYISNWHGGTSPTPLSPNEQYTHVSLWSLLSAPLIFSGDITRLDPFTFNLLTNDEIVALDQDPLGKQGYRVKKAGDFEIWKKELEDGSIAVGLFNLNSYPSKIILNLNDLNLTGSYTIRDLWRKKDLGVFNKSFETVVYGHGVVMLKITKK